MTPSVTGPLSQKWLPRLVIVTLAITLLVCGAADAKKNKEPKPDRFGMEQRSPHVAWGNPLEGGPIRVLFIAPRYTLRDTVELAERLELKVDTAPLWDATHAGLDAPASDPRLAQYGRAATLHRIRELLDRNHQLFVLAAFNVTILPNDILATIEDHIKHGAGLLLARVDVPKSAPFHTFLNTLSTTKTGADVTRGIGEALTTEWTMGFPFVKTLTCGTGRVVRLDYVGPAPATHCLLPTLNDPAHADPGYLDTYFSLVAKAARWAAGRTPPIEIKSVTLADAPGPSESEIPPGFPKEYVQAMRDSGVKLPYHTCRAILTAPANRNLTIQWQVREPGFKTVFTRPISASLSKGSQTADLQVFAGPGKHDVDVWLLDNKRVLDWFTQPITIEGWPDLAEMRYSKSALLANDTLDIAATIRPNYAHPRPCTLYARAWDPFGRLVAESYRTVPPTGGAARLRLNFVDLIAHRVAVEVFVVDKPHGPFAEFALMQSAHDGRILPVRTPYLRDTFSAVAEFPGAIEYNERAYAKTLSRLGIDTVYFAGSRPAGFYLTEANVRPLPSLAAPSGKTTGWGADPASRKAEDQRLQDATKELWGAGSQLYSLGNLDALRPTGADLSQSHGLLQTYRDWLQQEYPDLAHLNAAWGASIASWGAIEPVKNGPNPHHAAPWLDQQRFLDSIAANRVLDGRAAIRATDGGAVVGVLVRNALNGIPDWTTLAPPFDLLCVPAGNVEAEKLRAYGAPGGFTGEWFSAAQGLSNPQTSAWAPWHAILHGLSSVWYLNAVATRDHPDLDAPLDPYGRPTKNAIIAGAAIQRIKAGIGKVLLRATRVNSGIAIYDRPGSGYLDVYDSAFNTDKRQAETAWIRLLDDLGYSFDFISEPALRSGGLNNYRLLILPMARALDSGEAEAVQRFEAAGGHVLADLFPGRYDVHGAPYARPPLARLFGVTVGPASEATPASQVTITVGNADAKTKATVAAVVTDASVAATAATPMGRAGAVPIWLLNKTRSGATVLLNHALTYAAGPSEANDRAWRTLFGALLPRLGAEAGPPAPHTKKHRFDGQCLRYRYGAARLVAALRDPWSDNRRSESVRIFFDGKEHVYDVLKGALLRRTKSVSAKLKPGGVALYAQLPYVVSGIILLAPQQVPAGRRITIRLKLRTQDALAGEHVVHLELAPRNGSPIPYYSRNVVCPQGEGETYIPTARNQALGFYQLTARDVLTGVTQFTTVEIITASR